MNQTFSITVITFWLISCCMYADQSLAQTGSDGSVDKNSLDFEDKAPAGVDIEDLLQGFEEEPDEDLEVLPGIDALPREKSPKSTGNEKPPSWRLEGEFAFTTTYNFSTEATPHRRGFSMLRPESTLTLKNRFSDNWQGQSGVRGVYDMVYGLRGRDNYTSQVLGEYENELELKDTFIQGRLTGHLDAKIGRQMVVWGTLDSLRVTDVLNPLDLRLPGMTDIDDLRLPVTMVTLDYYIGDWDLSGMAIPEVRFSKLPAFGSDFFPFTNPLPPEDIPDDGFKNMQYAAALTGIFSGWDIGFYWADIYADQTYAKRVFSGGRGRFIRKHARTKMLGTAVTLAAGNWLLKAEAAGFDGLQYTNTPGTEYTRLDLGCGVEYAGFNEATVSMEAVNRHIFDHNHLLKPAPDQIRTDEYEWTLRITKDLMNETLTLSLFASIFGIKAENGAFERLDVEYDIADAVSIRGGVVFYQSGDRGLFQGVDANDRLFVVLKYSF